MGDIKFFPHPEPLEGSHREMTGLALKLKVPQQHTSSGPQKSMTTIHPAPKGRHLSNGG